MKTAQKNIGKNLSTIFSQGTKGKKDTTKKVAEILSNTEKGMAVNLPENVSGDKVKKARKLGAVMAEKVAINSAEKDKRASLTYNLNALKGSAEKYVQLLATEHDCSISVDELVNTLKTPKVFLAYLSEKQRAKFDAKALKFNYWLVLTLVSKYIKAQK